MTYTLTLSTAERGLLLHALLDQILRRGAGGIEVYHDILSGEDATPEALLERVLQSEPTRATPPDTVDAPDAQEQALLTMYRALPARTRPLVVRILKHLSET